MTSSTIGRSYGGRSPDERRADRRDRLVAAAVEVYGVEGYQAGTVEVICRRAGVSPKYLYEQFDGRNGIFLAAYDAVMEPVYDAVTEALAQAPDALDERIGAGVHRLVSAYLDDPRTARIACVEAIGVSPALDARRRHMLRRFAVLLADEAARFGLVADRAFTETLCLALVGGANELFIDWITAPPGRRPPTSLLEEVLRRLITVAAAADPRAEPTAGADHS